MAKLKKWTKFRHKLITTLARPPFGVYIRLRYGINIRVFRDQAKRPYFIMMNHQTGYDQFFVAMAFPNPVYYVASEDIFSMGWVSDLIRYLVEPIPIRKQTTDLQAVKNCIKVAREGGSVCIAPEGNRTFHGKNVHMRPAIAALAKKMGLPIAVFRIEGGYGVQPRWSDVIRRGTMRCYVSRVIEPEEYANYTADELFALLQQELYVDEGKYTGEYRHKKNAEFLERAMYVCPWCGLSEFESRDDVITCNKCGRQIRHLPSKELKGINCEFPHSFVSQWYEAQDAYINQLDLLSMTDNPVYREKARVSRVHLYKRKELLVKEAELSLYGDRITIDGSVYPFREISYVTVLGKNKVNIYTKDDILQLKGDKRFNALKYVHFFHRYKNITAGNNETFLGI